MFSVWGFFKNSEGVRSKSPEHKIVLHILTKIHELLL